MSDVLPQIEPETGGQVTRLDVPLSRYLGESFKAGQDESMFHTVSNITEDQIDKDSSTKTLDPAEANAKYGVGSLKFTESVNETMAQAMSEREKTRMDQSMYLSSGATKGRFLPGMAVGILGSMANPLDFGSMFVPFVGEGKFVEGAGMVGKALSRGLIPAEKIAKSGIPLPKLVGSMAQAAMWGGMAEIPKIYESHVENQPLPNIGADVLGQAAFAGILHGVGAGLRMLRPETGEAMEKQAVNDFLQDKDISAHQYVSMDEHVIQYQAIEHDRQLREEAANQISLDKIKNDVVKEQGEYPIDAALRSRQTGEIRTGPLHPMIPGYESSSESVGEGGHQPDAEFLRGFVTDKGRFVERKEADQMTGSGGDFLTAEALHAETSDPDWLSHEERIRFDTYKEEYGLTDAEAINKIRDERQQRRKQRILANPHVQEEIESRRQAAIQQWVEDKKKEMANPIPKETQRAANEPTVPHELVEKYNGDQDHLNKSLDEDIEALGGQLEKPVKPAEIPKLSKEQISKLSPEDLQKGYDFHQGLAMKALQEKNLEEGVAHSTQGQFYREALENKGGQPKVFEPTPSIPNAIDEALNCILKKIA